MLISGYGLIESDEKFIIDLPEMLKEFPCNFGGYPGTSINVIPEDPHHTPHVIRILRKESDDSKKFHVYSHDNADELKAKHAYIENRFSGIYVVARKGRAFHLMNFAVEHLETQFNSGRM